MTAADGFALLAVLVGASAQAITGIGFSLVCAPLLVLAMGGADGVRLANVLAIAVNLLILWREARGTSVRHVLLLLVPAAVSAPLTARAIAGLDAGLLSVACGILVLLAVAALAGGLRVARLRGRTGAALAGAISGMMNVVGGVGGPAVASYALNAQWPAAMLRPTLATYFLGINVVSVAARGVPPASATFFVLVTVVLVAGFALGALLARRLDHAVVRAATLALAAAGACAAVVQGLA